MPLTAARCTNCGGILEVDSSKDAAICPFCNTPYVVEKAINNYYTTNNIQAASVNIYGASADDLFRDAQTFTEFGAYEDASQKYMQMMTVFPSDPRGSMGVVRLAIEHHTALSGGKTQLSPLRVALKLGDKEFLNWLYQNFERDEQVIRAGLDYMRDLGSESGDEEFLERLNRRYERICQRIRTGECDIGELGKGSWYNDELRTYSDCVPCVKELLDEAKANVVYFNSWINKVGLQSYREVGKGVIERLWAPMECVIKRDLNYGFLSGGIIGNEYYFEHEGNWGPAYTVCYYLGKVITQGEIDTLFQEIMRCKEQRLCPYCGIGRKGFFSGKCNHCGH